MNPAHNIYEKLRKGDELSDIELRVGIQHFQQLADLAIEAGPVFHLAFVEAQRVASRLREFRDARRFAG